MQARDMMRKLHLLSVVFPLVFLVILTPLSTASGVNGLQEQSISSSAVGNPVRSSRRNSDPLQTVGSSGSLNPQAQAALDAAWASLKGHSSLSDPPISTTIAPNSSWANRNPATFPPARSEHALAYDASAGKVILFGGYFGSGYLNDTWAYDYATNTWNNRNPTNPPPLRASAAIAYDASAGKVILFGGRANNAKFNDTWAYDYATNTWTNRNPATPPPVRYGHALACDVSAGKVILFGGWGVNGYIKDTWAYDYAANTWVSRNPSNPPPWRWNHALTYDASAGKVILFGGANNAYLNDTWAYDYAGNSWVNRNPANPPPVRNYHALAYDASASKVVLFGGSDSGGPLNDTWAYDYANNSWTNCNPTSSPVARAGHALAYDASADKMILFGGRVSGGSFLNETWALTMGGGATQSLSYDFTVGWNLIGVPVVTPSTPAQIFNSLGNFYLFAWSPQQLMYVSPSALAVGKAYWLKVFQVVTGFTISGQAGSSTDVPCVPGWNMIASPLLTNVNWNDVHIVKGAEVKTIPQAAAAGWMQEGIWRWNGTTYLNVKTNPGYFAPGVGTWVKSYDTLEMHFGP